VKGCRHSLAPVFSLPIVFPLLQSSPCDIARNAFATLKLFDTAADLSVHSVLVLPKPGRLGFLRCQSIVDYFFRALERSISQTLLDDSFVFGRKFDLHASNLPPY
jgi:hypothetical protein